ncbi:MAG TPA: C1 family peptidase [Chitinophaga sp.]|uniref:C1 family peptidase n=1 Tax=Chitinophaga sp. TaxID=1869181 RepID=UPI002DBF2D80|nr:C1 family peptidase [Chitinophaga sp.]HEU4555714.1 C1 family peptidase [Chitinophaga sp.]
MRVPVILFAVLFTVQATAQTNEITVQKKNAATTVKNQAQTGTCWCFSTTSLVESECLRKGQPSLDLSEMFTVRNMYLEKAQNYIRRQGAARFDEGGLGHDVIHAMAVYGAMPESAYSGLINGQTQHNHSQLVSDLRSYLDSLLKAKRPIPDNWQQRFTAILDQYLGKPPATFEYKGHTYTPLTFAKEVVKFDPADYAFFTSFTHHPFYQSFIVEVPDNFSNGAYYNVPLKELVSLTKTAVENGYTVMWDADVSNRGWMPGKGYALAPANGAPVQGSEINPDLNEQPDSQEYRQRLYEELVTQDDHLMHIIGLGKSPKGKDFFIVKNSWGTNGPLSGYVNVSEPYFALNTITVIMPKAALNKAVKEKLAMAMKN